MKKVYIHPSSVIFGRRNDCIMYFESVISKLLSRIANHIDIHSEAVCTDSKQSENRVAS